MAIHVWCHWASCGAQMGDQITGMRPRRGFWFHPKGTVWQFQSYIHWIRKYCDISYKHGKLVSEICHVSHQSQYFENLSHQNIISALCRIYASFLVFAARRILLPSGQLWFVPSRFQPCLTNLPTVKRPFHIGWFCSRVSVLNNICYRQGVIWFHVNVL